MHGRLIVFEGVEGCGKTTQIKRLQQWLVESQTLETLQKRGFVSQLLVTRQPGGTELGQVIRQILLNYSGLEAIQARTELLLYAADRAQHVEASLKPQLNAGALIVCDRFTDSTVAYQGYGRTLDLNLIHQLNSIATNGLQSDLTLWLDLDVEIGLARTRQRGTTDRIEQDSLAFHQRVQQGFTELAAAHPQRIVRIDANQSEDEVSDAIKAVLQQWLTRWYPVHLSP